MPLYKTMLVRLLVRWLVGWLVGPRITSKTDYVAFPLRLGFGDPLVFIFVQGSDVFHF
jgi:hypothetical protein